MKKQFIALIFLLTTSKIYCNDFTPEELHTIKTRLELYHVHTNLIVEYEQLINNQEIIIAGLDEEITNELQYNRLRQIRTVIISVLSGFLVGGVCGVVISR